LYARCRDCGVGDKLPALGVVQIVEGEEVLLRLDETLAEIR
jgi:hypothetical protein